MLESLRQIAVELVEGLMVIRTYQRDDEETEFIEVTRAYERILRFWAFAVVEARKMPDLFDVRTEASLLYARAESVEPICEVVNLALVYHLAWGDLPQADFEQRYPFEEEFHKPLGEYFSLLARLNVDESPETRMTYINIPDIRRACKAAGHEAPHHSVLLKILGEEHHLGIRKSRYWKVDDAQSAIDAEGKWPNTHLASFLERGSGKMRD